MIDKATWKMIQDTAEILRQNRRAFQTVGQMVSLPPIDVSVIRTLNAWSEASLLKFNQVQLAPATSEMIRSTNELAASYAHFTEAVSSAPKTLSSALLDHSVVELFSHTRSVEAILPASDPGEQEVKVEVPLAEGEGQRRIIERVTGEVADELQQWLKQVHPDAWKMWRGTRRALDSESADRTRQVMVSLRTLLDTVIKQLAPDDEVRAWSDNPKYYQPDGETPTWDWADCLYLSIYQYRCVLHVSCRRYQGHCRAVALSQPPT